MSEQPPQATTKISSGPNLPLMILFTIMLFPCLLAVVLGVCCRFLQESWVGGYRAASKWNQ